MNRQHCYLCVDIGTQSIRTALVDQNLQIIAVHSDPQQIMTDPVNNQIDVRPDYVKTSTGFGSGGATLEDVALLLECVGDIAKVKASGGIRTLDFVLQLIDMGVSRIGSSNSVNLVEEYRSSLH